jgi:hypothetical protein
VECHACGRRVALAPGRRIGTREECEGCGADLHSCLGCAHHDPSAYNECREASAERVLDKERANRCDYFAPAVAAGGSGRSDEAERARADLERLFRK